MDAARNQVGSRKEVVLKRFQGLYKDLSTDIIKAAIARCGDGEDGKVHTLLKAEVARGTTKAPTPVYPSSKHSLARTSSTATVHNPTARSSSAVTVNSSPMPSDFDDTPRPIKVTKGSTSNIYKNRDKGKSRRRDPDEDDSAEEASDGSAADWSSDDGRKKKKRKMADDEVDAEGAALKAFNEEPADVLTGTIGELLSFIADLACSADQAAIIIKHRPYTDLEDLRVKVGKARGVSMKLFEQYTEIMEGYVQIDACLSRCEGIAKDIAGTLSVWRSAGENQDGSVIGTPRADGLNDVKVDIKKVSELLRKETDSRKRKILAQYIKEQPAKLSKGTVLKDYQLLGVNWLNLLFAKKIGCILADEMGKSISSSR